MPVRTPAKKRPLKRIRTFGKEYGMGRRVVDAQAGWEIPERETVKQRGGRVSRHFKDGSIDRPDSY